MELTDSQIKALHAKAASGGQLNDLQKLIQNEFQKSITYMETRFLISDLGIEIQSEAPVEKEAPPEDVSNEKAPQEAAGTTQVKVTVDQVKRPGAMVSGAVSWSDGVTSEWVIDEMGRLGVESADETYQPSPTDVEEFQLQLRELIGG